MSINVTTAEEYSRVVTGGLRTCYDLPTIQNSQAALNAAVAEYDTVYQNAWAILKEQHPDVDKLWWDGTFPSTALDSLYNALRDAYDRVSLDLRASNTEFFPVGKWDRTAATCRAHVKRIRKALAAI